MKRIIGWVVILIVVYLLYKIIAADPVGSGKAVKDFFGNLATFLNSL